MNKHIELGALAPLISKQLDGVLPKTVLKNFDKVSHAISLLYIHNYISTSEAEKARKRLIKSLQKKITEKNSK